MKSHIRNSFRANALDAGRLLLRLGGGLTLLLLFGLPKLRAAAAFIKTGQWMFVDFNRKAGLPFPILIALYQTANESVGALLVATGLFSRVGAGSLAIGFGAATYLSIRAGEDAWLIAGLFFLIFASLLLIGPGRFSIDHLIRRTRSRRSSSV
jgi:uncharacterized membrane protein YphA (DoxX/SURF4 family)